MLVLFDFLKAVLPQEPDDTGVWTDGEQILCRSQEQASVLSDLMQLTDRASYSVGYHSPEGIRESEGVNGRAGWYYVYS